MRIHFVPIRSVPQLGYVFGDDAVTATALDGASEHYDFEGLPDGRAGAN